MTQKKEDDLREKRIIRMVVLISQVEKESIAEVARKNGVTSSEVVIDALTDYGAIKKREEK